MRYLADFILDSDLCLKENDGPLTFGESCHKFSLTLSNIHEDNDFPRSALSAQLIFEASSLENIRDIAFEKLAEALSLLAYVTNRKFAYRFLKRVIDWTPGLVERDAIIYTEALEWDVAEPGLDHDFLDTAERLMAMQSGDEQQIAMRWYRLGLQADNLEEQFSYFWFALEIAAETLKGTEKVPSKCPKCQSPLLCEKCGSHPVHRRYRGDAIEHIIDRVHPENSREVFEVLQRIRHTLMHGRRITSIRSTMPCDEQQAINKLAFVTWHAIGLMFNINTASNPESPLMFGYTDNFVRRKLVAGAHITATISGDQNNPQIADFPTFQIDVMKELERPDMT